MAKKYGLGIDQIVGAQYVNAAGELVEEATEEALVGLRGGGGSFGIITELTIKVYPLEEASRTLPATCSMNRWSNTFTPFQ